MDKWGSLTGGSLADRALGATLSGSQFNSLLSVGNMRHDGILPPKESRLDFRDAPKVLSDASIHSVKSPDNLLTTFIQQY